VVISKKAQTVCLKHIGKNKQAKEGIIHVNFFSLSIYLTVFWNTMHNIQSSDCPEVDQQPAPMILHTDLENET